MTDRTAIARAVAQLRVWRAARDLAGLESGAEALRALDPEHPEIDLAMASLWEARGRTVDAAAARLRGHDRVAASTGDPIAASLVKTILAQALDVPEGYAVLQPASLVSSDPAILSAFLTVACNHGYFDDGAATIAKLRDLTGGGYRDAEDVVVLGRTFSAYFAAEAETAVVRWPLDYDRAALHHSVVTQAILGAAERRDRLTESFAQPFANALEAYGVRTEGAVFGALRHLLALGRDACATAFFDLAAGWLTTGAATEILDHALASAVRRDAIEAARCYGQRFDHFTGCETASLNRLSSHVGVRAHRRPAWAASLKAHGIDQTVVDERGNPRARPFPADGPANREDGRIDVFLKCVKRPFDIHPFVSFWMECFSDPARYRLRLLDDSGLDLADHYARYPIADSRRLRHGPNVAHTLFSQARRPLDLLGWESVANLTPFAQTSTRWFWNIDADDIRPLIGGRIAIDDVRRKLNDIENFAADNDLMAISYDLWASAHYLFDHGYHWTFGICLCRSDPVLLGRMLASLSGCDIPSFRINLDHLLSRLSDGQLGSGQYRRYFSSFIFDKIPVHQKDPTGMDFFHRHDLFRKYLAFDLEMKQHIRAPLHPKTVVV